MVVTQSRQGLIDLDLQLTARRLARLRRRLDGRGAIAFVLSFADSVDAFAPQDAERPPREHGWV